MNAIATEGTRIENMSRKTGWKNYLITI